MGKGSRHEDRVGADAVAKLGRGQGTWAPVSIGQECARSLGGTPSNL